MRAIFLLLTLAFTLPQSGYEIFQQALTKERAEGNIREAIPMYERVLRDFSENRTLAAKALVQLGLCYEKLGSPQARRTYEQVVRSYADQQESVAEAKFRLGLMEKSAAAMGSSLVSRRIWAASGDNGLGGPSPDGRFLSYIDSTTLNLAIREIATGQNRLLTKSTGAVGAASSRFSPDGKQIAYTWFNADERYDLRLIGADGSQPRTLVNNKEIEYVSLNDWTADGKQLLVVLHRIDKTSQIAFVSTANAAVTVIKTLDWRYPNNITLSPDGRYIVYDLPTDLESRNRNIYLLPLRGGVEVALVDHPANDSFPIWTPDGKQILFMSDRGGSTGIWMLPVANGRAAGAPQLIKKDATGIGSLGFTKNGDYWYSLNTGTIDVYTATLDQATGKLLSPPVKSTQRFEGGNSSPAWSYDGRYLAYRSKRGGSQENILVIRDLETGNEREILPEMNYWQRSHRWSPDGKSIVFTGQSRQKHGIYRLELQSTKIVPLLEDEPGTTTFAGGLSPDGRSIFYSIELGKGDAGILMRDLTTGTRRQIYTGKETESIYDLNPSPHGKSLAFSVINWDTGFSALRVFAVDDGKPRDIVQFQQPDRIVPFGGVAWTPDGRYILYLKQAGTGPEQETQLWRVPSAGGEPQQLGLTMDRFWDLRLHPDGKRIAFSAGRNTTEIWVMENFLAKGASR